ncbi:VWA domain-containing protein, partial [Desulfovibrio sp. OttesenSCG-928-M14]|nr:VWA domain-containing protein [Desulfovibrio sp. OttesenSCG-928-M14]
MTVNDKPLVTGLKINTDEGVFEITGVNKTTGEVSYTYTLTAAYEHAADTGPDQIAEGVNKFEFKVNGLTVGVLNVNIEDDAPLISIDGGSAQSIDLGTQADSTELKFTAEGLIERNYGADNAKTTDDASRDGTEEYITIKHYSVIEGSSTADPDNPNSWDSHTLTNVNFIDGKAEVDLGGRGLLYLTKTEQGLEYTYIAKNGTVGDEEHITIGITDSDGDYAGVTLDVNMNYPVPAGTALIDEAGLENGSHHPGWFGSEGTVPLHLDEGTVSVCWDIDSMPALKADIGDGYQAVTWVQGNGEGEGSKLFAKVGDTVVLEVSPNVVEGSMDVILNYPVDHSSSDSSLGLLLPYTPETVNNNGMPNNVHITIKDDHPMPLSDVEILAEPDTASYNVYLALDVSGSMYQDIATNKYDAKGDVPTDNTRMHAALDALQVLVQSYKDAGADARFTLLEFGSSGAIVKDGVTADEMLTYLKAQDYMSKTSGQGTNYAALSQLQSEIEADLSLSTYQGWENKVYFLSDGAPDSGKPAPSTWQNTMDQLNVDVISVGIDVGSSTNAQKALKSVANSGDEVINVSLATGDYDSLTEALLDTMEQKLSGNLLGNDVASADGMNLDSITFGGTTYSFTLPDGAVVDSVTIDLGNGLTMTVEKDGDYTLIAKNNIADDYTVEGLKYTVSDNDGDTREANVTITLRDSSPLAHDNVAQGHSPASLLDTFTDGSSWESAGGDVVWNQACPSTSYMNHIPGATGALNPDSKGVLLTANGTD